MKFFILVLCAVTGSLAQDYCDKNLCQFYNGAGYETRPHIGCPGVAKSACPAGAVPVNMDATLQAAILEKHNSYRNALAGGQVNGFATAAAMTEMTWDAELAALAAKNAGQCVYGHDTCHNTKSIPNSGQNIAQNSGTVPYTDQAFLEKHCDNWWNENTVCTQAVLDKYQSTSAVVGHFTQMSADRATKVGCAAMKWPANGGTVRYTVCNYGYVNMSGQPIYVKGAIKSKCTNGASAKYANLCKA